jgi:hypothetical protein
LLRPMEDFAANQYCIPEEGPIERAREDEARASRLLPKRVNSCAKKWSIFREGEHGARSAEQAIAIGLSKARRAGVKLPPPKRGKTWARTRRQAERDLAKRRSPEAVTHAIARDEARAQAGGSFGRFASGIVSSGAQRSESAICSVGREKAVRTRKRRRSCVNAPSLPLRVKIASAVCEADYFALAK